MPSTASALAVENCARFPSQLNVCRAQSDVLMESKLSSHASTNPGPAVDVVVAPPCDALVPPASELVPPVATAPPVAEFPPAPAAESLLGVESQADERL